MLCHINKCVRGINTREAKKNSLKDQEQDLAEKMDVNSLNKFRMEIRKTQPIKTKIFGRSFQ